VFTFALQESALVVCTGGLGPTEDDLTRDAIARVLNRPLDLNEDILERIRQRFARRNLTMAEINRRQAMVPRGAIVLENAFGTAPGLLMEAEGKTVILLPGPPREMIPMLERVIREHVAAGAQGAGIFRRVLKLTGRTESEVDAAAEPVYSRWRSQRVPISTTILAVMGRIGCTSRRASGPDEPPRH
jgi:nicotinamide-nucleotide amidase